MAGVSMSKSSHAIAGSLETAAARACSEWAAAVSSSRTTTFTGSCTRFAASVAKLFALAALPVYDTTSAQ